MKVAIVCAGRFPRSEYPLYLLKSADRIICCDSALMSLEKRGIVPDVVIGDLDSVCHRALGRFKGKVVRIEEQESNDLSKAFHYVMKEFPEVSEIHILAATGLREDHTVGNLSLLMQYEKEYGLSARGVNVDMVSDYSSIFAIGDSCELHVGKGRAVSVFCCDSSLKLKSEGLEWPTDEVVFDCWWKGTLNRASRDIVKFTLSHPSPVLVVLN